MAQNNMFQETFVINVLELIMVKKSCDMWDLLHGIVFLIS